MAPSARTFVSRKNNTESAAYKRNRICIFYAVVGAGLAQALGQVQIVGTKDKVAVFVIVGVVTTPGVHGIAGTAHGIVKIGDGSAFQFDHKY